VNGRYDHLVGGLDPYEPVETFDPHELADIVPRASDPTRTPTRVVDLDGWPHEVEPDEDDEARRYLA
jgi:hypothetical protein